MKKSKPKTTREHMALQVDAIKSRPYVSFSGVNMLERAKARSSYDRRRAIPHSRNLRGSGWVRSWDVRVFRLAEVMKVIKSLGRRTTKLIRAVKMGIPYRKTGAKSWQN